MFSSRVFQITFLISLITHSVILFQNSNFAIFKKNIKEQKIEISYVKNQAEIKEEKNQLVKKELFPRLPTKISIDKTMFFRFQGRENVSKINKTIRSQGSVFNKPALVKSDIIALRNKITLSSIEKNLDKTSSAAYIAHSQIVYEKIKRALHQNYFGTEMGEIRVSFVLSSDGSLKELKIIEDKSSPSLYLKEIVVRSIKEASPFPKFPKDLDYPQLPHSVTIAFKEDIE